MPERDNKGRFEKKYSEDDFLEALEDEELTTGEVSEVVECPYKTAYYYLNRLEENGEITSRKRARARFWSIAEETDS